MPNEE
jgi:hypothetical protein